MQKFARKATAVAAGFAVSTGAASAFPPDPLVMGP